MEVQELVLLQVVVPFLVLVVLVVPVPALVSLVLIVPVHVLVPLLVLVSLICSSMKPFLPSIDYCIKVVP